MEPGIYTFQFVAGHPALDFVNTVAFRGDPARRADRLQRAEYVQRWSRQAPPPVRAAIGAGLRMGGASVRRLRAVREDLFAVFHAAATGAPIPADSLARVGSALQECRARRRLRVDGAEIGWAWRANARATDRVLHPILAAATDLLTSDALGLVRQCEDVDCGWLFLDRSNARRRRWCSMADCGNRNKARNFYRRGAGAV